MDIFMIIAAIWIISEVLKESAQMNSIGREAEEQRISDRNTRKSWEEYRQNHPYMKNVKFYWEK